MDLTHDREGAKIAARPDAALLQTRSWRNPWSLAWCLMQRVRWILHRPLHSTRRNASTTMPGAGDRARVPSEHIGACGSSSCGAVAFAVIVK